VKDIRHWWQSHSPAARLATSYVAIIMIISLFFSLAIYNLAANQLGRSLQRQYLRFNPYPRPTFLRPPDPTQIQVELDAGKQRLAVELIYFNALILLLGSVASYWLAKQTLRPIEEALEAQSRFTADASHELRTPLTAMQTEIEVALRNPKLSKDDARRLLQSNLEELAKLAGLSDALLRLARQHENATPLSKVSLEEVAVEALNRVMPQAQAKRVNIDNKVGDIKVVGDTASLIELLVVLLDNAIKYSGGGTTITISAEKHSKQGRLTLSDQGHGIKASDLPYIFQRFFRADPSRSKEKVDGYGLGLSIAHQIVDWHGGSIEVDSYPGRGTTFVVSLPLAEA